MDIQNPRRVLAVSLEDSSHHLSHVIKALSGSVPEPQGEPSTLSGITHDLALTTPYYTTTLPVWLDLISSPEEWAASFLSEEAKEVLDALGGLVLVFAIPAPGASKEPAEALIRHVGRVVKERLGGWQWDGVGLVVGMGVEGGDWEDVCAEVGLEFVLVGGENDGGRNEFGEKVGIPRVLEALQANDWTANTPTEAFDDEGELPVGGDGEMESGFYEGHEEDFEGLRKAIWEASKDREEAAEGGSSEDKSKTDEKGKEEEDTSEDDVQKIEQMMARLRAAREMGEGMPEDQRRRIAAKAVAEAMRDL